MRLRLQRLLPQLEAAWRAQSAPIAEYLAPAITQERFTALSSRHGVTVPEELAVLWQWHDGTRLPQQGRPATFYRSIIAGPWDFLSMEEALVERDQRIHEYVPATYRTDPNAWEGWWDPNWIPFATAEAAALFVDLRQTTPAGTVPVRHYDQTPTDPFTPCAGSLAVVIGLWVEALKRRYRWWSTTPPGVHADWEVTPDWLKFTHLVG